MRAMGQVPPTRIFFLGRENFPRRLTKETYHHSLKQWPVLLNSTSGKSKSVTLVAAGSLVPEALKAADILEAQGIGAVVLHCSNVNNPDFATLEKVLAKTGGAIVTVEDHRVVGGMGSMLAHALVVSRSQSLKLMNLRIMTLGVGDHFGQSAYSALELYKKHGLDAAAIAKAGASVATQTSPTELGLP
jgi:transketolase